MGIFRRSLEEARGILIHPVCLETRDIGVSCGGGAHGTGLDFEVTVLTKKLAYRGRSLCTPNEIFPRREDDIPHGILLLFTERQRFEATTAALVAAGFTAAGFTAAGFSATGFACATATGFGLWFGFGCFFYAFEFDGLI